MPRRGNKEAADFAALLAANGDVLQVRRKRGDSPGARFRLVERGTDASVGFNLFEQSVAVSRFQLGEHAVFQHVGHDRKVGGKVFKHLRIRRIAALGLLLCRKAELIEQNRAKLFRRVDVELFARLKIDAALHGFDLFLQRFTIGGNGVFIHKETGVFHACQHLAQRKLHIVQQRKLFVFAQPIRQKCAQSWKHSGAFDSRVKRLRCVHFRHRYRVFAGQPQNAVIVRSRVEQISGKLGVHGERTQLQALFLRKAEQLFCVRSVFRIGRGKKLREEGGKIKAVCFNNRNTVALGKTERFRRFTGKLRNEIGLVRVLQSAEQPHQIAFFAAADGRRFFGRNDRCGVSQMQLFNDGKHLQPCEQANRCRRVALRDLILLHIGVDRRIAADGAERAAQKRAVFSGGEFVAHALFDVQFVKVVIDIVDASEALDQIGRAFLADARNARNLVGGVAHDRFQLDHLRRRKPVFGFERFRVVGGRYGLAHFGCGKQNGRAVAHQLQRVAVAGCNKTGIAVFALRGKGAENVVGLIAFLRHDAKTEIGQQFLEQRHLARKLGRHPFSARFVAVIKLMAEGRCTQIERNRRMVGFAFFFEPDQDIHESVNAVGKLAVLGRQKLDAVKGAVDDTVAVNDK